MNLGSLLINIENCILAITFQLLNYQIYKELVEIVTLSAIVQGHKAFCNYR